MLQCAREAGGYAAAAPLQPLSTLAPPLFCHPSLSRPQEEFKDVIGIGLKGFKWEARAPKEQGFIAQK